MNRFFWLLIMCTLAGSAPGRADDLSDLRDLVRHLQQRVDDQQRVIESLTQQVAHTASALPAPAPAGSAAALASRVIVSGEAAIAFVRGGSESAFPVGEFRIDEARLFLDAQLMADVYFFTELILAERENGETAIRLGELYLEAENLSRFWNRDDQLSLRVGRLDIPFGEEYLARDPIDNPLIMHSLADFWGIDEGVELFGRLGPVSYVAAVQNGGISTASDFDSDKAIVLRLSADPVRWLHVALSGLRTGNMDAADDFITELWFGNGFFRSLGNPATTQTFHAELIQGDVRLQLPRGHIAAAGGYAHYADDDRNADNTRDIYFYHVEALGEVTRQLYLAGRFSQILASEGYPIVANGDFGAFFFGPLTKQIWRLSLGAGYRFHRNLVLKAEYMIERGSTIGGGTRNNEDLFAVELAGRF